MAAIESLRPEIIAELPACPGFTADRALVDACRSFARDTWLVRADVAVSVVAGAQSYVLPPPAGHEIVAVPAAVLDGSVDMVPVRGVARLRLVNTSGTPSRFWYAQGSLSVYPIPNLAAAIVAECAVAPLHGGGVADDKFLLYTDAIASYALFKLKSMTNQAWTDPNGALFHYHQYKKLASAYRTEADTSGSRNNRRVSTKFF